MFATQACVKEILHDAYGSRQSDVDVKCVLYRGLRQSGYSCSDASSLCKNVEERGYKEKQTLERRKNADEKARHDPL
jgi:hypothetical protein